MKNIKINLSFTLFVGFGIAIEPEQPKFALFIPFVMIEVLWREK